jgi:hypothetical protein
VAAAIAAAKAVARIVQPPLPEADASASFSSVAQSSQQTSTALPPIVTVMTSPSSLQSQAAHVFSTTAVSFA